MACGRPGAKDLHSQRRTESSAIEHEPALPRSDPTVPFSHQPRMTSPPHHLAQGFLRARAPVGTDAQVQLASGSQTENPLAAVLVDDLDVPVADKLQEAHPQGRRRGKPGAQVLGQGCAMLLQVQQHLVVSGRQADGHRWKRWWGRRAGASSLPSR